ncbi:translesion DNA synthesis-associated protein ImuA [Pseudomaricurvus alkylphenolicus]|jgi:cell division inhibitor SulA|uniref:translesion DNA synthesis-associated protein ImuA n=1 Tax=Pseudomaricurvus alkylphenolicus TaxID=1306991 RepID=UPI00142341BA|nr:translesion DNA synthesis-associated protein ImuA [Pseudomaricurvus alkylphenolicus]NIB44510.1 translesion DNA synthesis-associated protein ImuA [Pseudomaricurvus alkylphenolicus]
MKTKLDQLLQLPNTWQASQGPRQRQGVPTGYAELDQALHLGGWPPGATTELLLERPGMGELRLLLPGLLAQQQRAPWLALIDPPWLPYAPAWQQAGIDLQRLLILQPRNHKELLWSADQCLRSSGCSAVLTWCHRQALLDRDLRRLQQAATAGNSLHWLMRHHKELQQASPSALRLGLLPAPEGQLQLNIIKQRGGWSGQNLQLALWGQPQPLPVDYDVQRRAEQLPSHLGALPQISSDGAWRHAPLSARVTALRGSVQG